jgi:hypothetical protein
MTTMKLHACRHGKSSHSLIVQRNAGVARTLRNNGKSPPTSTVPLSRSGSDTQVTP